MLRRMEYVHCPSASCFCAASIGTAVCVCESVFVDVQVARQLWASMVLRNGNEGDRFILQSNM